MTDLAVTREEDEAFENLAQRLEEVQQEKTVALDGLDGANRRNEQLESQVLQLSAQLQYAEARLKKAETQRSKLLEVLRTVATEVQLRHGYLSTKTTTRVIRATEGRES